MEVAGASPRTSRSVCTGECVSWVHTLHTHLSTAPHFRQPSGPASASPNLLACLLACLPYLIIPPPRPEPPRCCCCLPPHHLCRACCFLLLLLLLGPSQLLLPRQSNIRTPAGASETPPRPAITPARPRHLSSSSSPARPPTSRIGLPAFTCCAHLDYSSTLDPTTTTSRPTSRLSSVTQRLTLTFCIFL